MVADHEDDQRQSLRVLQNGRLGLSGSRGRRIEWSTFNAHQCARRATRLNIDYPVAQSEPESTEESEFEADADDFVESSTDDDSAYDDGDGSDGSDAEFNESGTDSGDNWDALEAKAAASDKKKKEAARARGSDESDLDRPKKKNQANGKSRR